MYQYMYMYMYNMCTCMYVHVCVDHVAFSPWVSIFPDVGDYVFDPKALAKEAGSGQPVKVNYFGKPEKEVVQCACTHSRHEGLNYTCLLSSSLRQEGVTTEGKLTQINTSSTVLYWLMVYTTATACLYVYLPSSSLPPLSLSPDIQKETEQLVKAVAKRFPGQDMPVSLSPSPCALSHIPCTSHQLCLLHVYLLQ